MVFLGFLFNLQMYVYWYKRTIAMIKEWGCYVCLISMGIILREGTAQQLLPSKYNQIKDAFWRENLDKVRRVVHHKW